ncbi:TylF/MycF/NovP-related O-methyltransferase [Xenorhabdus innexi]|uniref:Macrocin-O-methyltransferase n=1 Tax=Xenorhabdus innexi TaxID=290109 RepID=A0A1N6MWB9_9GAMM|nr:TylF/MycF/NovP-related O-methyltransferase [Xenorhabdus innexi]PHM36573.1 macrocin-O-methyltransferase [Xenorhabdus innexi]SIP73120.1 putative Macrocin-O-methyltransferase [Xenorhabdus innexi]
MYLDLLGRTLTNRIYEPEKPKGTLHEVESIREVLCQLSDEGIDLGISAEELTDILQYTKRSRNIHTYVSEEALSNIRFAVETVHRENIEGDLLDCGVLRGGTSIYMAGALKYLSSSRKVYVADSFSGLPSPSAKDGMFINQFWHRFAKHLPLYNLDCLATIDDVKENFHRYGLLSESVVFTKGWFADTLPCLPDEARFSVIRIDADWYSSTLDVLNNTYHKLSENGFIIIDDYHLPGCQNAVDEFRKLHGITAQLEVADKSAGVFFWRK